MTYKDIEGSRNIRLWLVQVVVPLTSLAATTLIALPEARHAMGDAVGKINKSVKRLFKRESKRKLILVLDAKNKEEALYCLEAMRREIVVSKDNTVPLKLSVHLKD